MLYVNKKILKQSYDRQDIHQRVSGCIQIGVSWEFCKALMPEEPPCSQLRFQIELVWVDPGWVNRTLPQVTLICCRG